MRRVGRVLVLLDGHVRRRADRDPAARAQAAVVVARELRDPEIEQLDRVRVVLGRDHEDVARLQVAVDHAGRVRVLERAAQLQDDVQRAVLAELAALGAQVAVERMPLEVGDHQEQLAVVERAEAVDREDVVVAQARRRLGLALEPQPDARVLRIRRQQHLDHLAQVREALVLREIDRAHAALRELALDHEPVDPPPDQVVSRLAHRFPATGPVR